MSSNNVYIKLMKKKSLEFNIINKSPGNFSILFITENKDSFNDESKIIDTIICFDIYALIKIIKKSSRISNKYKICKIIDEEYKYSEDECFVWLYERNFEDNYIKFLNYISEKSNKINEEDKPIIQRRYPKEEVSIYRGVKYTSYKPHKFMASISKNKIRYYLGIYEDEKVAAYAYNCKALELYGKDYKKFNEINELNGYTWNADINRVIGHI
jgi:hypothetical protein